MQQKDVEEPAGIFRYANRRKRIEVDTAYFNILDAAIFQRVQRSLTRINAPLRPDRAIELVLDL